MPSGLKLQQYLIRSCENTQKIEIEKQLSNAALPAFLFYPRNLLTKQLGRQLALVEPAKREHFKIVQSRGFSARREYDRARFCNSGPASSRLLG